MAKEEKIRYFKDLYDYFERHKERYFLERIPGKPIIEVTQIDKNGNPTTIMKDYPSKHIQLAKYIFKGIEVSRQVTIDEDTMKAVIKTLDLDPNIFEHPPHM
jgi:hypothetical protein